MEKIIIPAFETKKNGKRSKLTGYIGELRDGDTILHSKEYASYHAAEVALDSIAFDILSDLATEVPTDALPAFNPTTCVYCHKPHHPQHCPEKNALLFAPDAAYAPSLSQAIALGLVGTYDPVCKLCGSSAFIWIDHEMYCQSWWQAGRCAESVSAPLDVDFAPCGPEV